MKITHQLVWNIQNRRTKKNRFAENNLGFFMWTPTKFSSKIQTFSKFGFEAFFFKIFFLQENNRLEQGYIRVFHGKLHCLKVWKNVFQIQLRLFLHGVLYLFNIYACIHLDSTNLTPLGSFVNFDTRKAEVLNSLKMKITAND